VFIIETSGGWRERLWELFFRPTIPVLLTAVVLVLQSICHSSISLVHAAQSCPMPSEKCPNCGMEFANQTSVLKHMNHRFSSCNSFFLHGNPLPASPDSIPHTPSTPSNLPPQSLVFPDAGYMYGRSDGFMGWFHNDAQAAERTSNHYYPFQSKGEWELASFLSQSGLSMKRIDEFLSLNLVR
jgi:hypothetical protein